MCSLPYASWSTTHGVLEEALVHIDSVATGRFYLAITASVARIGRGTHRILVALARNDRTLYHVPVHSVTITVT
jgi:hypothetical protein